MLSLLGDSFDKFPAYGVCSTYNLYDSLHFYNKVSNMNSKKANRENTKNARVKNL
jgi:hypothetical protein